MKNQVRGPPGLPTVQVHLPSNCHTPIVKCAARMAVVQSGNGRRDDELGIVRK
eukprot:CAMPEP_0172450104 /NCGR_PEP_ID=MMETSP1065-20121228/8599_1 /TAXON_ID=265537 /ORGANISM="Amphiprora paludosa, Strain CCMP125" /LENGTH=52 /DNA_ID=CAMNT_0013201877 /DNA_START=318 /DNA_END=473 /DNA_ORIENTATION=+